MDLSSMLNDSDPIAGKKNHKSKEKSTVYQLSTSLHYLIAKDNASEYRSTPTPPPPTKSLQNGLLSSPFKPKDGTKPPTSNASPNCPCLSPSATSMRWTPKLSLKLAMKDHPLSFRAAKRAKLNNNGVRAEDNNMFVQLKTHEIIVHNENCPKVLLEDSFEVQGDVPRSFFVLISKKNIPFSFVFNYPDNPWFEDVCGLRKSVYFLMRTAEGEQYELHLKPTREKQYVFGYLLKRSEIVGYVKDAVAELMKCRKLPLVLDLDDTLVRLIGEGNNRFVKEADVHKCRDRVAVLKDGRRVVLTERVHEFLEWAHNFFEISVCSLGDQNYVDNVVNVLDPQRQWITGILYSARSEHDYIKKSIDPGRPPKDLLALYSFCAMKDKSLGAGYSLPLILDDETRMWPEEQHDNIVEVGNQVNSPVWSVSLFPVVKDTLQQVHQEFFRQYDMYQQKLLDAEKNGTVFTRLPPNVTTIYKTNLRHILRDFIAKGPPPFFHKNQSS